MSTIKVIIDSEEYDLDLDKAKELKLLTKPDKPIRLSELKAADIYRVCSSDYEENKEAKDWYDAYYIVIVPGTKGHSLSLEKPSPKLQKCPICQHKNWSIDHTVAVLMGDGTWKTTKD